ncbi:hypothetical protein BC834DRAFT_897527 [Gloeopeniophorella convolvens]|nr:hypothetical protein BC834DRAFT_897527 [Gloeopeniophorella convolvens]
MTTGGRTPSARWRGASGACRRRRCPCARTSRTARLRLPRRTFGTRTPRRTTKRRGRGTRTRTRGRGARSGSSGSTLTSARRVPAGGSDLIDTIIIIDIDIARARGAPCVLVIISAVHGRIIIMMSITPCSPICTLPIACLPTYSVLRRRARMCTYMPV